MAALRIVPMGLAIPWPAMSGAEPWMGSYSPNVVLSVTLDGGPARDADGKSPSEPGMTLASSERLHPTH